MEIVLSLIMWGGGVAILLLVGLIALLFFVCIAALPRNKGNKSVQGIDKPVHIIRDVHHVPHIFAASDSDAYFGYGYVHAQDRLWQMETARRMAAGRMCELSGGAMINVDKFMRMIGIHRRAEGIFQQLDDRTKKMIEAYCAGINAYIRSKKILSFEFFMIRHRPEVWKPSDVILISHLTAFMMNSSYVAKLIRFQLDKSVGNRIAKMLMPGNWFSNNAVLTDVAESLDAAQRPDVVDLKFGSKGGSNAWAILSENQGIKSSVLANDPHVAATSPCFWHVSHVTGETVDFVGASIPGIPGCLSGHNQNIAWGITNLNPDVQDLYILDDEAALLTEYQEFKETIFVKGKQSQEITVKVSSKGAIVTDVLASIIDGFECDQEISLKWSGMGGADKTLDGLMAIDRANNWPEFKAGLAHFSVPVLNFVYSDRLGNIGYKVAGDIPCRTSNQFAGIIGSKQKDIEWDGYIATEDLAEIYSPECGYVASVNDHPSAEVVGHTLNHNWVEHYRYDRILSELSSAPQPTIEFCKKLQLDRYSSQAAQLLPRLLTYLDGQSERELFAINELSVWDFVFDPNNTAPTMYYLWIDELGKLLYAELLPEVLRSQCRQWSPFVDRLLTHLMDNPGKFAEEISFEQKCEQAFKLMLDEVDRIKSQGNRSAVWGSACSAAFNNPTFASVPILHKLFNVSGKPSGDWTSVNFGGKNEFNRYQQTVLASYRQVIDFSKKEQNVFMICPGQSGHIASRAYNSFKSNWDTDQYKTLFFAYESISENKLSELILSPINIKG